MCKLLFLLIFFLLLGLVEIDFEGVFVGFVEVVRMEFDKVEW